LNTIRLAVRGMTDRRSVRTLTAELLDLAGVESVQADHTAGILTISGTVQEAAVHQVLRELEHASHPD
jgi:hypothetical protein